MTGTPLREMLISTTFSFIGLLVLGLALETILRRRKKLINQNPQFLVFQKRFLATEIVILLADWLQAPYNYKVRLQKEIAAGLSLGNLMFRKFNRYIIFHLFGA